MKNEKGFTLIELLVVIAIIGLLSTMSVIALNSARLKSRDARRLTDIKQIQTALEMYYNENANYPSDENATPGNGALLGSTNYACLGTTNAWNTSGNCEGTTLMNQVPSDPNPGSTAGSGGCDSAADADVGYWYESTGGSTYSLYYCLEDGTDQVGAGEQTACEGGVSGC